MPQSAEELKRQWKFNKMIEGRERWIIFAIIAVACDAGFLNCIISLSLLVVICFIAIHVIIALLVPIWAPACLIYILFQNVPIWEYTWIVWVASSSVIYIVEYIYRVFVFQ
mgnify:CR=1 FL=1